MDHGMAPKAYHKELFVNLTLLEVEQGVASLIGGLFGRVTGDVRADERMINEVMPVLIDKINTCLARHGWTGIVTPILLPPVPGQLRWKHFQMSEKPGSLPAFLVFRVQVHKRLSRAEQAGDNGLMGVCGNICESCDFMTPRPHSQEGMMSVQLDLQELLRGPPQRIDAQVEAADATDEYYVLQARGFTSELAGETINKSRLGGMSGRGSTYAGNNTFPYGGSGIGGGYSLNDGNFSQMGGGSGSYFPSLGGGNGYLSSAGGGGNYLSNRSGRNSGYSQSSVSPWSGR